MKRFLAHADVILAGMIITLLLIDRVNDAMKMIDHPLTKWLLFALCGAALLSGLSFAKEYARRRVRREQKERKQRFERR